MDSHVFFSSVKIQKSPTKLCSAGFFSLCMFYHEDFIVLSAADIFNFTGTWHDGLFNLIFFCFKVWILIVFWEQRGGEGKKQTPVQMQSEISENFRWLGFCGWFSFGLLVLLDASVNLNSVKFFLWSKKFKKCFHLLGG